MFYACQLKKASFLHLLITYFIFAPTSPKTSCIDKLLGKLGFDRFRPQRTQNKGISAPKSQVPYNIEEHNFFDCVEDDEEI